MAAREGGPHDNGSDSPRFHGSAQRRLAVNACVSCRQRKTKCDEARPACGRCTRLRLPCTYLEAPAPRDSILAANLDQRLHRLEAKIDLLGQAGLQAQPTGQEGNLPSNEVSTLSPQSHLRSAHTNRAFSWSHSESPSSPLHARDAELAIPPRHSTAPQNMLLWPCAGCRFSMEDVLYPLVIETTQPRAPSTPLPPKALMMTNGPNWIEQLTFSHFNCLAGSYFQHFHPRNMILDEREFYSQDAPQILRSGFDRSINSSLLLLVLAIGSISAVEDGFNEWQPDDADLSALTPTDEIGDGFFNIALSIFSEVRDNSWSSVRCWLLIAFFHSMKLQVYEQWRAIFQAAMTAMLLLRMDVGSKRIQCQLYWVIYLQESQLLAELDFPSSGISRLERTVPLPFADDDKEQDEGQREHRLIFLAEISLRRMLNRVHLHIYDCYWSEGINTGTTPAPFAGQALTMIGELDNQLESWRVHLPQTIQVDFESNYGIQLMTERRGRSVREKMIGTLRARYFAAKAILFRPLVYRILHTGHLETFSHEEASGAATALEAALQVPLCSGLLCDNLRLVPLLINPARSFFALAILSKFISSNDRCRPLLPQHWETVSNIRDRLTAEVAKRSALVRRDIEILSLLDSADSLP